jgi:hypothetical protein
MGLYKLLAQKKPAILKEWLAQIFASYPPDASGFLAGEKNSFANPVGCTIATNAECILAGLTDGRDTDAMSVYLEPIIRIRAVQDFTPSQAVSFMAGLKTVVANQIRTKVPEGTPGGEWEELMTGIDRLHMQACETYAQMKEEIGVIRSNEITKREGFFNRSTGSRSK